MENMTDAPTSLDRLDVLTDLVAFAESQLEKGSVFTSGWCNPTQYAKWLQEIQELREELPEKEVKEFDERRKQQRHRDGCECFACRG